MAAQYQPSREPPYTNTNTLALHANLEGDGNDSDFMQDTGDSESDSTEDDVSLEEENDMNLENETIEPLV